jgi:hypothetical protein
MFYLLFQDLVQDPIVKLHTINENLIVLGVVLDENMEILQHLRLYKRGALFKKTHYHV